VHQHNQNPQVPKSIIAQLCQRKPSLLSSALSDAPHLRHLAVEQLQGATKARGCHQTQQRECAAKHAFKFKSWERI